MSDFGTSEDFETARDALEKNRSASAADEALAALDRIEARLRNAQQGREYFSGENAKLINERNRGWHNHELPDGLTSHSHTQGPYAHLREAEAEAERQERYIESLEAERDQWKAGTFPGWTRDDVYKELADKYRELEAERDELRGALERAIARQAPEGTGDA